MVILLVIGNIFNNKSKGLDEELADAVDEAFYESYKRWKMNHPNANTWQQVIEHIRAKGHLNIYQDISTYHQAHWFSWDSPVSSDLLF